MSKSKKAEKLADLILQYGGGLISKDRASLIAYRYYLNKPIFPLFEHTSLSQLANNFALAEKNGMFTS